MKNPKTPLYNVAHPLAESGKPIFIPFGEWNYDGQSRQRLDRAHGEKIANELNARVAKGDPGIPVYQGHPDVPALASKYPDKGALGWITRIELVNEGGKDGLALTVEWDRDPGRGFRWFSPYWLANSRDGGTYIVDEIASIGLVNNPNIPEFRLANEGGEETTQSHRGTEFKLPPQVVELAKRRALANVVDKNGMEHVEAGSPEGGQFAPKTDKATSAKGKDQLNAKTADGKSWHDANIANRILHHVPNKWNAHLGLKDDGYKNRASAVHNVNALLKQSRDDYHRATVYGRNNKGAMRRGEVAEYKRTELRTQQALHRFAIMRGFTYNPTTHQYE